MKTGGDLSGVYGEIANELNDIVDDERHVELATQVARNRNLRLDKLRQQWLQQTLDQMSDAMQNMTVDDMQRVKDMLSERNDVLGRRQRGVDPQFEIIMQNVGDFFPEQVKTLDELLEIMARRTATAQAMLNSMTPEHRTELQVLSDRLLED